LLSAAFEIVPLSDVANRGVYAAKVLALTCCANALGAYLYRRGLQRARALAAASVAGVG